MWLAWLLGWHALGGADKASTAGAVVEKVAGELVMGRRQGAESNAVVPVPVAMQRSVTMGAIKLAHPSGLHSSASSASSQRLGPPLAFLLAAPFPTDKVGSLVRHWSLV